MRNLVIAFLLLLAVPAAAKDGWHVIKDDGLGFTVAFPSEPRKEEQTGSLDGGGKYRMSVWQLLSTTTGAIYDVTVAEYPKGSVDPAKVDDHLDGARNGAVANSTGPLVGETKLEFAGRSARELVLDMSMGHHARTIIFIDGDRLFSLGAITRKDSIRSPAIERFFASFKLTGE